MRCRTQKTKKLPVYNRLVSCVCVCAPLTFNCSDGQQKCKNDVAFIACAWLRTVFICWRYQNSQTIWMTQSKYIQPAHTVHAARHTKVSWIKSQNSPLLSRKFTVVLLSKSASHLFNLPSCLLYYKTSTVLPSPSQNL